MASGKPDPTPYTIGALKAKSLPSNHAEGEHIRSFQLAVHRLNQNLGETTLFVQRAGPLSDYPGELKSYADMYCRGLREVETLLKGVKAVPNG